MNTKSAFLMKSILISSLCLLSTECLQARSYYEPVNPNFDASMVADAIPKDEPKSRYGNPAHYTVFGKKYHVLNSAKNYSKEGVASWYGPKFNHRRTSSGEEYDMYQMTAANKELPLPTYAQVTNLENGKSVTVKINDRGPFKKGRIIDLSYAAAKKLEMTKKGTARVRVTAIDPSTYYPTHSDTSAARTADIRTTPHSNHAAKSIPQPYYAAAPNYSSNNMPAVELTRYVE